jgi:hypothetical protein
MVIVSEWVRMQGQVCGPKFGVDFPDFAFVVEPESQRCQIGDMVRLRVMGPGCEDLTEAQERAIRAKYQEM